MNFDGSTTSIFWPFSDKWILLAYPFHVLLYVFTSISKLNENKAKLPLYILPLAQGVFLIPLLDINYYFLTGENLIFTNDEVLRYIMFGLVFLIFWDVVNIRPRMQKEKEAEIKAYEAEKEAERQAALIQEAPKEIYPNAGKITNRDFVLYIDELIQGKKNYPSINIQKKPISLRTVLSNPPNGTASFSIPAPTLVSLKSIYASTAHSDLWKKGVLKMTV